MVTKAAAVTAAGAGAAVVRALGAEGRAWLPGRCAGLVGRGDAAREAGALERLDRTAAALAAAEEGDRDRLRAVHAVMWQGEFAALLDAAGTADERDRLLDDLTALVRDVDAA
ncbi:MULTISPECIES: hypothetical protein [unclassified Streptomyces]|uniref:hypothetical protein n=1 Tax=unclassified Streptomyces TaxID=2593676 RepID=UPI003D7457D0